MFAAIRNSELSSTNVSPQCDLLSYLTVSTVNTSIFPNERIYAPL